MAEPSEIPAGTLRARIAAKARDALAHGSMQPIATELHVVEDGGVRFAVRVGEGLASKPLASTPEQSLRLRPDPFVPPYDVHLFVGDLSPTHVCLLNKYNVLDEHVLVITRAYEPQEALLTPADFVAWWRCLNELDGLGFYNAGALAGASQPHKHMQVIGARLGEGPQRTPMDALLSRGSLPFAGAQCRFNANAHTAHADYLQLLAQIDRAGPNKPYNLLVTRSWMWAVPRTRGFYAGIEVNSLGFAGALLAKDHAQLQIIRNEGPIALLQHVSEALA